MDSNALIDRAKNPQFSGIPASFTHSAQGANLSCGDEVQWFVTIHNNTITQIRHVCRACTVCTASADLLAQTLTGKSADTIQLLQPADHVATLGIPLSPMRERCAILPIQTLQKLEQTKI